MKSLLASLLVLLTVGCASPSIQPVAGESLAALKTEKIAVSHTLVAQRINYIETLYRVLWLETKTSSQDFSGLWQPDADLSGFSASRLRQQGFAADPVHKAADNALVEAANKEWAQAILAAAQPNPQFSESKLLPLPAFFLNPPAGDGYQALASSLRDKGYRYLVQLSSMDIHGNAPGYGMVLVGQNPNTRVVDLQSGKVVWSTGLFLAEVYQLGGDFKALEIDGMKKTKEGLAAGIHKIDFASLWGFAPLKN